MQLNCNFRHVRVKLRQSDKHLFISLECQTFLDLEPNQLSVLWSVQLRSRLGPGQLYVNSKSFDIKVYFKSLTDLDLELVAIIAMPPPTTHHP